MNELKHPCQGIKIGKKETDEELNSLREQGKRDFIKYIDKHYEDREVCYDIEHKKDLKCDCFESLFLSEYQNEIVNVVSKLCTSTREVKNEFVNSIIGAGFYAAMSSKGRNQASYIPIKEHVDIKFCKHIIRIILGIGRKKYNAIVCNYALVEKNKHGNLGKICNKQHFD